MCRNRIVVHGNNHILVKCKMITCHLIFSSRVCRCSVMEFPFSKGEGAIVIIIVIRVVIIVIIIVIRTAGWEECVGRIALDTPSAAEPAVGSALGGRHRKCAPFSVRFMCSLVI